MENFQKNVNELLELYKSKNYAKAESFCRNLLKSNKHIILYNILGIILFDQKKINESIEMYKEGIKINPNFGLIYSNLGNSYKTINNLHDAEKNYKKAIEVDKKIPEPYNNLGNLYRLQNKHQKALDNYKNAIVANNDFFWAHYNLGVAYIDIGNFDDAKKCLENAIKLNPYFSIGHRTLSRLKKYKRNDKHLFQMQNLHQDKKINEIQKKDFSFALGKAYEDIRDFTSSFQYYKEGNELHRKNINFSINEEKKEFEKIKNLYNKKLFEKNDNKIVSNPEVIFILGMPRSGTTLVEQIISNHPDVFGGEELNFIPQLIKGVDDISSLNNDDLKIIGTKYLEKVKDISNNSKFVTDKLPINFKWIGFIKLILPNAKILHCCRNPRDNCFSIFKNFFSYNINFAYSLNEIAGYYELYLDLMDHWKITLPNFIHDVTYENVILNNEKEIKKLIKLCGLTWDDKCLEFYKNKKPIKTASDIQARSKIYNTSINSWKNYEGDLDYHFSKLPN